MDWPLAVLILGSFVTTAATIFKIVGPRAPVDDGRKKFRDEIIEKIAKIEYDIALIKQRFEQHERHEDQSINEINHQLESLGKKIDSLAYHWSTDGK